MDPILITVPKPAADRQTAPSEAANLARLQMLAQLMDSAFHIPGMKLRFGFDAILGLIPGLGDFATSFISLYILQEAHRRGVSRLTLARMGSNILIDWLVGSIPLVGDAFDVYWKSNQKNVALLLEHHEQSTGEMARRNTGDWIFLIVIIVILIAVLIGSLTVSVMLGTYLFHLLFANK